MQTSFHPILPQLIQQRRGFDTKLPGGFGFDTVSALNERLLHVLKRGVQINIVIRQEKLLNGENTRVMLDNVQQL